MFYGYGTHREHTWGTARGHGTAHNHGHHLLLVTPFLSLRRAQGSRDGAGVVALRSRRSIWVSVDFLDGVIVHNELIPRLLGNLDLLVERDYLFREGYLNDLRGGHLGEHLVLEYAEVFRAQPSPP